MDVKLAAVIVHDIKNALGVLEGVLQEMTTHPTCERAVSAHETCSSLRDKLIGFLTLYKSSEQGLTAQVDAYSPEDFLSAVIRAHISHRPDVRVSLNTTDMPVLGFFDESLVGLALEAALHNATRFARSSVELTCTKADDGGLVFMIRDDGAGLGTKEEKPSTGLGMALCHAIAQAHRKGDRCGTVSLHNHLEGGALFSMYLP